MFSMLSTLAVLAELDDLGKLQYHLPPSPRRFLTANFSDVRSNVRLAMPASFASAYTDLLGTTSVPSTCWIKSAAASKALAWSSCLASTTTAADDN